MTPRLPYLLLLAFPCVAQEPPPIPLAPDLGPPGPELVEVIFLWDAPPDSDHVSHYIASCGTNTWITTNCYVRIVVPLGEQWTARVRSVWTNQLTSPEVGYTTAVAWSNWVEVTAVNMRLVRSQSPRGPFADTGKVSLASPAGQQFDQEYFGAVADAQIHNRRRLVETPNTDSQ